MGLSECDNKFYAMYTRYNNIYNGIDNDCHEDAFTGGEPSTPNGKLYTNVSDNGGFNWDYQRNLTSTYTTHCDHEGIPPVPCGADMWISAPRFGMQVDGDDFSGQKYLLTFFQSDIYSHRQKITVMEPFIKL
jgi:hypothetical protein